ncbi:hypothetical protein Tco_0707224 [Tanacetum coccineum]|uniref:Uncharacterized protein n=1 Tax=Tanacetum coccineum TaxID=301880 RepID=A0ABQ4Y9M8_9ASTR
MSSSNHLTSGIEDAFSSNFMNYLPVETNIRQKDEKSSKTRTKSTEWKKHGKGPKSKSQPNSRSQSPSVFFALWDGSVTADGLSEYAFVEVGCWCGSALWESLHFIMLFVFDVDSMLSSFIVRNVLKRVSCIDEWTIGEEPCSVKIVSCFKSPSDLGASKLDALRELQENVALCVSDLRKLSKEDMDSILEDSVDENSLDDNLDDTILDAQRMLLDLDLLYVTPLGMIMLITLFDIETVIDDTYDDNFVTLRMRNQEF